jgi:hypothetical protein
LFFPPPKNFLPICSIFRSIEKKNKKFKPEGKVSLQYLDAAGNVVGRTREPFSRTREEYQKAGQASAVERE